MIVDVHTQLWDRPDQLGSAAAARWRRVTPAPWQRPNASPAAFDQAMQAVDCAIVLGFESQLLEASIPHEQVAAYVARRPQQCLGFAGIDPTTDHALESLDQAVALGLVGVVISPAAQDALAAFERTMCLLEACAQRRLPVMVLPGLDLSPQARMEQAQPYLLDAVARALPELRLVLAEVGHPFIDQALALLDKHAHVYADLSGLWARPTQLHQTLQAAQERQVLDKLLFGSGFPWHTPAAAITSLHAAGHVTLGTRQAGLSRAALAQIVQRDALACLGLSRPKATAAPMPVAQETR